MSTILDALRKSEQERREHVVPTLEDYPVPEERTGFNYLLLALIVLLLTIAILLYMLFRNDEISLGSEQPVLDESLRSHTTLDGSNSGDVKDLEDELAISVLSYSDEPARRFVIVDGTTLREGDFLKPGVKLVRISAEAVSFNVRGQLHVIVP